MKKGRFFLIDSYGFIFRAYHARARSGAPPMRTTQGISTEAVYIFHNMLRRLREAHKPEYITAVFESGKSFREAEFTEYKANRAEMPPDLNQQIPYIRKLLDAMRIPILEVEGFEADDVIGSIACRATELGVPVVIVSSDKDMLQVVDDRVSMLNPMKNDAIYDPEGVKEFMGVEPKQIPDLLALKGDSIDNIPGAPGIGDKGARDLITEYGSVEATLEHAAEVSRKTYRESLQQNRDQILLSKKLATIDTKVPIDLSLEQFKSREPDDDLLRKAYTELEFFSLLKELGPAPDRRERDYQRIPGEQVSQYLAALKEPAAVALAPSENLEETYLAISTGPAQAVTISTSAAGQCRDWFRDPKRPKWTFDSKNLLLELRKQGVEAGGLERDVMLEGFLLSADPSASSLPDLAQRALHRQLDPSPESAADAIGELARAFAPELASRGLEKVYHRIDLPLVPVLADMERHGIAIDVGELERLSHTMEAEVDFLTRDICGMAGREFNIGSPKQLGEVLFQDLKLRAPMQRGKGKSLSTAADVLEGLAGEHEIVRKVLEYRQVTKLKNTYVDALPALIHPETGRLHTTWNQTGASTGRLSSSNPNLQNIPIRTEQGREIRAAFIPRPGWKLISADYSQIELRLLAHFSQDPVLLEAFRSGEDIHSRTAAEVFGIMPELVDSEMRRRAKAVNFGIVYGLSPFGLSQQLSIPKKEAELYIQRYFDRYEGVRDFIDRTIGTVRDTGVVSTLFGRQRPIPDINSRNWNARGFAERIAVNTPLQGTAADLIKLAMIRIHQRLLEEGTQTLLLLQIHDELLLEAPSAEAGETAAMVKQEMENIHELDVPLVVDVGIGDNWRDVK